MASTGIALDTRYGAQTSAYSTTSKRSNPYPNTTMSRNEYPAVRSIEKPKNSSTSLSGMIYIPSSLPEVGAPPVAQVAPKADFMFREPPTFIIGTLLHAFHHISTEAIFFLDYEQFRDSAMLQLPMGHPGRPLPTLLAIVYLWGMRKSGNDYGDLESVLLEQGFHFMTQGLESDHPFRVMHSIQAGVLLAHYLFCIGRVEDGKLYLRSIVDLCFDTGLHQSSAYPSDYPSPTQKNAAEQERSKAFWAVFIINNIWSAGLNFPSCISFHDVSRRIDLPWPSGSGLRARSAIAEATKSDLAANRLLQQQQASSSSSSYQPFYSTVARYLQGEYDDAYCPLASYAKASLLYERASHLFALSPSIDSSAHHTTTAAFSAMNRLIVELRDRLPRLGNADEIDNSTSGITHALAFGAAIQLHRKFIRVDNISRQVCYVAAKDILERLPSLPQRSSPLCAVPWRLACEAMGREISLLQQGALPLHLPGSPTPITIPNVAHYLKLGVQTMAKFRACPVLAYQLNIMQVPYGPF